MKKEYIKPVATITDIKYESNLMAGSGNGQISNPDNPTNEYETSNVAGDGESDPTNGARGSNLWDDWD